jgi:hypothetical protein
MWMIKALLLLAYTKQTLPLMVAHKTSLHWHERLAGSPVAKLSKNISYRRDFSIYEKEDV